MAARPLVGFSIIKVIIGVGGTGQPVPPMSNSDQVEFQNNAGFPVNITFSNNLIPAINGLGNGQTSGAVGPIPNATVDFTIQNANNNQITGGPYSMEFGIGPLVINVNNYVLSPGTAAIPNGGQVQFISDAQYAISWVPANIWNPEPGTISKGTNAAQKALPGANGNNVSYTLKNRTGVQGQGTVKVGS